MILVIAAMCASVLSFIIMAKQANKTYKITSDYFYSQNYKILKYVSSFFIVSFDEEKSMVSLADSKTGECRNVFEERNMDLVSSDIQGDKLCLVYTDDEDLKSLLRIRIFDISNNFREILDLILPCNNFIAENCLIMDKDLNYIIISESGYKLSKFSQNGEFLFTYDSSEAFYSLDKNSDGDVYLQTDDRNKIFMVSESGVVEYQDSNLNTPVSFLDDKLMIDSEGNIFKTGDKMAYMFNTGCSTRIACTYAGGILISCDDRLLLIDNDTHKEMGQFTVNNLPQHIEKCPDSVVCFTEKDDTIEMEIIDYKIGDVEYNILKENSNYFVADPRNTISEKQAKSNREWKTIFDSDKLIGGLRGAISVTVNYKAVSETLTTDNGVKFIKPDEIRFSFEGDLNPGIYSIMIGGLCDINGLPVKLSYEVTVVKTEQSSSSKVSSNSSSNISSEISSKGASSKSGSGKIESDKYYIDRDKRFISGITLGSTLSEIKSNLIYDGDLVVYNVSGNIVKFGKIGTGCKIILMSGEEKLDELTLVIYGDVTGEGNINTRDLNKAVEVLLGNDTVEDYQEEALDVNRDGTFNNVDLTLLNAHINNKYEISQR